MMKFSLHFHVTLPKLTRLKVSIKVVIFMTVLIFKNPTKRIYENGIYKIGWKEIVNDVKRNNLKIKCKIRRHIIF